MVTLYKAAKRNWVLLFLAFFATAIGVNANATGTSDKGSFHLNNSKGLVYPFENLWNGPDKLAPCGGISPLDCSSVISALPINLDFSSDQGGLAETGFSMTLESSKFMTPYSVLTSYDPTRISRDGSGLTITSTRGLFYSQQPDQGTPSSANTNTQVNALGTGFIVGSQKFSVSATLVNPDFSVSSEVKSQQAGIWYGIDEDHYVKLAIVKSANTNTRKIQLQVEDMDQANAATAYLEINTANLITNTGEITLRLEFDPVANTAQGYYTLGTGEEILVTSATTEPDSRPVPASYFSGVSFDSENPSELSSFAGVYTSHRTSTGNPIVVNFKDFSVVEDFTPSDAKAIIDFSFLDQTSPASIDAVNHTIAIEVAHGVSLSNLIPTIAASPLATISPASGIAQDFSTPVIYTVTAEDGSSADWTVTVSNAAAPRTAYIENFDSYGTGVLTTVGSANWEKENGTGVNIPLNATALSAGTTHSLAFTQGAHTTDDKLLLANPITLVSGQPFYFATYFKVTSLANASNRIRTALRIDDDTPEETKWIRLQIARNAAQLIARVGLAGSGSDNGNVNIDSDQILQFIVKGVWNGTDEIGYEWSIAPKLTESATVWNTAGTHSTTGTPKIGRLFLSSIGTNNGLVGPIRISTDYSEVVTEDLNEVVVEDPFAAKINFQNESTIPPVSYLKDFGKQFGFSSVSINGTDYAYGWKSKDSGNPIDITDGSTGAGRNRITAIYDEASDFEKLAGTLVHFQGDNIRGNTGGGLAWAGENRGGESFWEIEIPNGVYEVTVGLGDKDDNNLDSRHSATIEGYTIIPAFAPTPGETKEASMIVEVTDGLLTMNGFGGYNSKITHIEIAASTGTPVSGQLTFDPNTLTTELLAGETGNFVSTLSGPGAGVLGMVIDDVENLIVKENTSFNEWFSIPTTLELGELTFSKNASTLAVGEGRSDKFIVSAAGFKPAELDVTLNVIAAQTEKAILTFDFPAATIAPVIDSEAFTVAFEVPFGTDITALAPTFTLSDGASSSPASGDALDFTSPQTYTVTASDASTQDWIVTVTVAEEVLATPCSPFSLLPCDQIVTSLPVNLTFDGSGSSLLDMNDVSTGFTVALPHSEARLANDLPITYPEVNGFEPGKLNVSGGNLVLTATQGIAFQDPPSSTANNTQVNSLGLGLDDISNKLTIETKLLALNSGGGSAQAGIWFGLDEDNFVKLDYNGGSNIEIRKEVGGLSATTGAAVNEDQIQVGIGTGNTRDITLRLVVDPLEMTITAYYAIGTGEFIQVTKSSLSELALPQVYLDGLGSGELAGKAFAGIYATYRSGTEFDATFDYFTIEEEEIAVPKVLSFDPAVVNLSAAEGEVIAPFNVSILTSDQEFEITLSDDPDSGTWLTFPDSAIIGSNQFVIKENLPAGTYQTTVTAQEKVEAGYEHAELYVNLTITSPETPPLALKINFSDPATAAPQGYLKDSGSPYGDRGNGYSYGWLNASTSQGADLTLNSRNRENANFSVVNNTLIHMQYGQVSNPNASYYLPDAKWEIELPNGVYQVKIGVGDPNIDAEGDNPIHTINAEGVSVINSYVATGAAGEATRGTNGSATVTVTDGKLTIDAGDGFNTKINYIEITGGGSASDMPRVIGVNPADAATNVSVSTSVSANSLYLPNIGGLDNSTITVSTVRLFKQGSSTAIAASVNGTGGGDAINLVPSLPLEANTTYRFEIDGVTDSEGVALESFTSTFTTGDGSTGGTTTDLDNVSFTKYGQVKSGGKYTSLVVGPDGLLYGLEIGGDIHRWTMNADGTLANEEILSAWKSGYGARTAIGFVFDPASTPTNLIAYITHLSSGLNNAPDWDGNISKLTGPNLATEQHLVTNLPRSKRDHLTNSLAFRPSEPTVLYFNQGSNSAAGAYDNAWDREESMLAGATLRLDLSKLPGTLPLDVQTTRNIEAIKAVDVNSPTLDGMYNPYYLNAPLTLFASGIRNAYDLVWHSNGQLYIPANGTAGGSNAPISIDGMRRPNGTFYDTSGDPTNYPAIPASNGNNVQRDWLFRVNPSEPIGYYGHPNPYRGEFVLNRGDVDVANAVYNNIQPDINYRGAAFDFEFNKSPNGVIEYKSNAENGNLQGAILVVRYSGSSDIIALVPDGVGGNIETFKEGIPGFTGFGDPLDLVEDVSTGNIYVADYARNEIVLLKPSNEASPKPVITVSTDKIVGDAITAGNVTYTEEILISNLGNAVLNNISYMLTGVNADQFTVSALPESLNSQNTGSFNVIFDPTSNGPKYASLTILGDNAESITIELAGLGKTNVGGNNEPSLQWILDTHLGAAAVNVGDADPTTNIITTGASTNYNTLIGDELDIQAFQRASDGPIELEVLSIYGPTDSNPVVAFGWYASGNAASVQDIFTVSNSPLVNGQTLTPIITGDLEFDPGNASFGFVSRWPYFGDRQLFSEDALNTFSGAIPHHVRVYAVPGEDNAYIIATEEHVSGFDYQDVVVIVRNVQPFSEVTPVEACSPISTLDCEDIDVTLPFALNFTGAEGGLANTGFTMVDNPSARIAIDGTPFNTAVLGFEPSKLSIANGNLTINANNGIAFVYNGTGTGTSTDVNSQINTLGAGFDADGYGNFNISTTLVDQFSDATQNSEQAGLWFGLNEDNFVKLVVDNGGRVEMRSELAAVSGNADQVISDAIANIKTSTVKLRLYVDLENDLLTAYYTVNAGAEVELGSLPLPAAFVNGNTAYNNLSFAGVFATKRRELVADVNYSFADFSIVPDNNPVVPTFGPLKINYSTAVDVAPAGYEKDSGLPFADRGNGYSYGWLTTDGVTPLDLSANTRNRDIDGASFIQNTIIHMQYQNGVPPGGSPNGTMVEGIWEVNVPNGTYSVTVGVGDLSVDGNAATIPSHTVNIEGVNAVSAFIPTGVAGDLTRVTSATVTVTVTDGKLTVDASGGHNTKIHSLEITQTGQTNLPYFTNVTPANNATNVTINEFQINVEIVTPLGYELNNSTLAGNINLYEVSAGNEIEIPTNSNDTGGGDAITLTPIEQLKENTTYVFRISGVQANVVGDVEDVLDFVTFESTFTTGTIDDEVVPIRDLAGVEFTKVPGGTELGEGTRDQRFSSLVVGPDGKLYASTIGDFASDGQIYRWNMAADGTLTDLEILTPNLEGSPHPVNGARNNNNRMIIGLVFDPNSTAENLIAYVTHSFASVSDGPEWDGKISKLTGANLNTVEDLIIHLPRSAKDHLTNSLAFDPAGNMYLSQGSNTAGGKIDPAWNNRPERLLAGAVLKIELNKLPSSLPLSVYTTDDISVINTASAGSLTMSNGTYNPYATGSPVTIFATGVRNAYDLVWHSNGWLYVPTNGTAGNNNNSPNSPSTTEYPLARRIDGLTSIPYAPALAGGETQKDWLFKTKGGTYHGHPNPFRGEFVLNHGGQTYSGLPGQAESSYKDVNKYPSTVMPDPNYLEPAYDFGKNKSPNGVIEYKSDAFGGKLQGLLMVVRFSGQDDLLVMDPKSSGDIAESYNAIPGLGGFDDPLDVVEDTKTGNIYISEYDRDDNGVARITLLRAAIPATLPTALVADPEEMIFEIEVNNGSNGTVPGRKTDTQSVDVTNEGDDTIVITGASIRNDEFGHFGSISPAGSTTLAPGESVTYSVTYAPLLNNSNLGYHGAELVLATNVEGQSEFVVGLHALKKNGFEGGNEPPLQDVVNALGIGIDVGWTSLANGTNPALEGEEVDVQQWVKAGPGVINVTPVGRYSPAETLPFGWYTNNAGIVLNEVGVLAGDLPNAQTLFPEILSGTDSFDPQSMVFGMYVTSISFGRSNYTEDELNTGGVAHRVRTYPMKDRNGVPIPNSYLVNFEDASNGDYQDYMFIIDNVIPYVDGALRLTLDPESTSITTSVNEADLITSQVTLTANGPILESEVSLSSNSPWLTLPDTFVFGTPFDVIIDKSGLGLGTFQATVSATAPNYVMDQFVVNMTITNDPEFTYQFNFQLATDLDVSPAGWIDDIGAAFGTKTTSKGPLNFGWVLPGTSTPSSAAVNGRNRDMGSNDDPLLSTFTIIGHNSVATYPQRDWMVELPNGTYAVNISVGDPEYADSYHKLDVNGQIVVDYDQENSPIAGEDFFANTQTVQVTDGILRLSLGAGGANAKPNYIRIAPYEISEQPPLVTASFDGLMTAANNYRGPVSITVGATDNSQSAEGIVRVEYTLNGGDKTAYTEAINVTNLGDYTLSVEAEDGNGNVTTQTFTFTIEPLTGASLRVENMTKVPGTQRSFPADDYYTFYRFRTPGQAVTHETNTMRLHNEGANDLVIDEINISDENDYSFEILPSGSEGTSLPLTIPAGGFRDVLVTFLSDTGTGVNGIFKETITILSNADNDGESSSTLHGGFAPQPEGGDEIDAQQVFDAFGFATSMRSSVNDAGVNTGNYIVRPSSNAPIAANVDAGYEGDLIISANFVQADPLQPVRGLQLSALHGGPGSNGAQFVQPIEIGNAVVGGMNFSHGANWYQTLLPKSGDVNSTTINADFANSITGPFRIAISGYSSAGGNNISGNRPDLAGLRIYKAIDREGNVIPNEYIALQDFVQGGCGAGSANCDWNDNTFYFINIRPEAVPTAVSIDDMNVDESVAFENDLSAFFDKGYPGNKLTYSLELVAGGEVPAWLTISELGVISGTAPADAANTYAVNVIATDLNGLIAGSLVNINVNKAPVPVIETDVDKGWAPMTVNFTGENSVDDAAIATYLWNFGDGTSNATTSNVEHVFATEGTYNVSLTVTDNTGLDSTAVMSIQVRPNGAPLAFATADVVEGMNPLTVSFDGSASVSDGTITEYLWDFGNGDTATGMTTVYTYTTKGEFTATLTITDDNSLTDQVALQIVVLENNAPIAVATSTVTEGTVPLEVSFDGSGSSDLEGDISYAWTFGDGATATGINPSHTFTTEGTYTVVLTVTDESGLTATSELEIVVATMPNFALRINAGGPELTHEGNVFAADQYFSATSKSYTNNSATVPDLYKTERSSAQQGYNYSIPVVNGTYTVNLHFAEIYFGATGGGAAGTGSRIFDVTLNNDLVLDNFDLNAEVGPQTTVIKTYEVLVTDGFVTIDLSSLAAVGGVNEPKLSAIEITGVVDLNEAPVAAFTYAPTAPEVNEEISFDGSASTDDVGVATYNWSFGDGATSDLMNPTHTYTLADTYEVELLVTDEEGATNSTTVSVVVAPENVAPVAVATATPNPVVVGETISFVGSNSTDEGELVYAWDFGDETSSTATDPTHAYESAGVYDVILTVTDAKGLQDTETIVVDVVEANVAPVAIATANKTTAFVGEEIVFTGSNSTDEGALTYAWNFGDSFSSSAADVSHIYLQAGSYTVSLIVTDAEGLTHEATVQIEIFEPNAAPLAVAGADKEIVQVGEIVTFSGSSSSDDVAIESYAWDFKDGSTSDLENPAHTFTNPGVYDVALTVTDAEGLTNSTLIQITVTIPKVDPVAIASATPNPAYLGDEVSFTGSNSTDDGELTYLWNFGDGTNSAEMNPVHTYDIAGTFTVSLTVIDSDSNLDVTMFTIEIDVPAAPEPDFAMYLNAGSVQTVSYEGKEFVGDQVSAGVTISNSYVNGAMNPSPNSLANSNRSSLSISTGSLKYEVIVPNGIYTISTYHVEDFFGIKTAGQAGKRNFDVLVEGAVLAEDVDL
ncbi:PKD domain-containing protein, partial [Algoriphagus chordae]